MFVSDYFALLLQLFCYIICHVCKAINSQKHLDNGEQIFSKRTLPSFLNFFDFYFFDFYFFLSKFTHIRRFTWWWCKTINSKRATLWLHQILHLPFSDHHLKQWSLWWRFMSKMQDVIFSQISEPTLFQDAIECKE